MCLACSFHCCGAPRSNACGCDCEDPDCWPAAAPAWPSRPANDDGDEDGAERLPVAACPRFRCEEIRV